MHDGTGELGSDPLPTMIGGDIEMPNPTHRRIADVWVTVQPAYPNNLSAVGGDEKGFP
jgi:hypothetical protein